MLGLSGGIDSALTLALAVDALGAEQVEAVLMPSRYTADMSNEDARLQAEAMGVDYQVIPSSRRFEAFLECWQRASRAAGGYHRGEYPGALPRHDPDGDLQQDRARYC